MQERRASMVIKSVNASAKAVRMSPRKVGEVARLVNGRTAEDALVILEHTPRRAAAPVAKVISSAMANAENNFKLNPSTLIISKIEIGQGFALKRFRPAAHGRALPYKKMTSNIYVELQGAEKPKKAAKKPAAKKADSTKTKSNSDSSSKQTDATSDTKSKDGDK